MNKLESRFLQNRMLAFYTLLVRVYAGLYEEAIRQALKIKNTYAPDLAIPLIFIQ